MTNAIVKIEQQMMELGEELAKLRAESVPTPVKNYTFRTTTGDVSLLDLFGDKDTLIAIHNMGQGCRYCTLWADGFNGFVPHLENAAALVLLSKDEPKIQRDFANSRGWRFRLASHLGGDYMKEQSVIPGEGNMPGVVCYTRKGNEIFRKNSSVFGPGDQFCSHWHLISLAGLTPDNWTPQYSYWRQPAKLDDGGNNLL